MVIKLASTYTTATNVNWPIGRAYISVVIEIGPQMLQSKSGGLNCQSSIITHNIDHHDYQTSICIHNDCDYHCTVITGLSFTYMMTASYSWMFVNSFLKNFLRKVYLQNTNRFFSLLFSSLPSLGLDQNKFYFFFPRKMSSILYQ